ncbi:MAG TPA: MaoC/PaaZ C-terminal domain-containing protein [Macromonas sp.]|nr:MaoC/PaaZ C-terminal domain-containing protein [Macromonas sp.]
MNLDKILNKQFDDIEHHASPRDCMLYALGIGVGLRPEDPRDLQFTYEQGLKLFPAMVNVICHPGGWITAPELEVNWVKLLHGEQSFTINRPLEPGKTYVGSYKVVGVLDKGEGKGAMVYLRKELREQGQSEVVSTVTSTYVLRGDGGCGGNMTEAPAIHAIPERAADAVCELPTLPQAALIYRLSGDYNPIHADPVLAKKAGFDKPILHGLCTFGVATRAIISTVCGDDPAKLKSVALRFSSPVYPGETIKTEFWRDGNVVSFRSTAVERNVVVLNNGRAEVTA